MQTGGGLAVQPLMAACAHRWLVGSQVSALQALLSLHAESATQQLDTVRCSHTRAAVSQRSLVHGLPSSQAVSEVQQLAVAGFAHWPALQLSAVQALPSLQSAEKTQPAGGSS